MSKAASEAARRGRKYPPGLTKRGQATERSLGFSNVTLDSGPRQGGLTLACDTAGSRDARRFQSSLDELGARMRSSIAAVGRVGALILMRLSIEPLD
jgi:hypothetical protein